MLDILITHYNDPDALDRCLRSLSRQTFKGFDVHVVDDFSSNNPHEVVSIWSTSLSIKFTAFNQNVGAFRQVERLYRKSQSPFFLFLHHDDYLDPDFLEKVFARGLLKHPKSSFAYSLYRVEEHGKIYDSTRHLLPRLPTGEHDILSHVIFSNWVQWSFSIINSNMFDKVGGFDRVSKIVSAREYDPNRFLAVDSYTWCRLSLQGPAYVVDERLGTKQLHPLSYGRMNQHRHLEEVTMFLDQIFFDYDLFSDKYRYLAKAVMISRIFSSKRLFETVQEIFDNSLFNSDDWRNDEFNVSLKRDLLLCVAQILHDFCNDDERNSYKRLLDPEDFVRYQKVINSL